MRNPTRVLDKGISYDGMEVIVLKRIMKRIGIGQEGQEDDEETEEMVASRFYPLHPDETSPDYCIFRGDTDNFRPRGEKMAEESIPHLFNRNCREVDKTPTPYITLRLKFIEEDSGL